MSAAVPLIAGAALGLSELGFSFLQAAGNPRLGMLRRLAWSAAAGIGGVIAAALVLLAATAQVARSLPTTIAGTVAAVAVVAVLSRAWRR
jgi:hypothetical protein